MTTQEQLASRCETVETAARRALDWINDPENAEAVDHKRKSLTQILRKGARRAQKLARSARTRMSVSVFGPSQAGKSFLVSVLARPADGRLVADFPGPGGALDYIGEINPEGEGESTGLVTRFTMTREPAPAGYPIKLVLLNEADVVRTIVNCFYLDGDQSEPPPEPAELSAHLVAFQARAGAADVPGMGFEDVMEVAQYVNGGFSHLAYATALRGFWDEAALIAPKLPLRERAGFLEILWGRHAALTELYLLLAGALASLHHAETAHVPLEALVPRETSIIDVKTLRDLFGEGGSDTLSLMLPSGSAVALPRAVVCALAAELVLPMQTQPSAIFAQTDLLDFPGARNRFKGPLAATLANPEQGISQTLLRGKVAYLFDRYVENQEITSMLLCVPDSNMETIDLPKLVENWIALTHGNSARLRAQTDCILFFILTKFDKHLGDSAAGGGDASRFERRMEASLLQKFAKEGGWVTDWASGQPFQNCFWLRNPNYFVEGLIEYDEAQREVRIRPEKVERIAQLREGCLTAASVIRHFAEPEAAWDAALTLNDGGVGYLTERLSRVCTPDSKIRQIGAQIEKLAADLCLDLEGLHVSDDVDKLVMDKRIAASEITDGLEIALQRHRFGAVLAALMVDQDSIQDRISRVPSSIRISSAVSSATSGAAPGAAPVRPRPAPLSAAGALRPPRPGAAPVRGTETAAAPDQPLRDIRTMTPEAFQAETAVEVWIDGLQRFRDDVATIAHFGLTQTDIAILGGELAHALRRCGVVARIEEQLRQMNFGHTVDKQAEPAAIVCAERINGFVHCLGTAEQPEDRRPRVSLPDGQERPVFASRKGAAHADDLPPTPRSAAQDLWTDWVFALDAMVEANARDGSAKTFNREQNRKIGEVLADLHGQGEVR